jgi:hypothetical protein
MPNMYEASDNRPQIFVSLARAVICCWNLPLATLKYHFYGQQDYSLTCQMEYMTSISKIGF